MVDAVVITLALVSLSEIRGGQSGALALMAPGLVSLATALLAVRLLPLLVTQGVRRTRASRRVASFLAVRNVGRRSGGMRLVVLLTVAVGLAVFAVDASAVAAQQRTAEADAEVGAATVVALAGITPTSAMEAVQALDPDGAWAMVATQLPLTSGQALLAVDSSRLGSVSAWTPDAAAGTVESVAADLHPPGLPPVVLHDRLTLHTTFESAPTRQRRRAERPGRAGVVPTSLSVTVREPDGRVTSVDLGTVTLGEHELSADLPGCGEGCLLRSFVVQHLGTFTETSSRLLLSRATSTLLGPSRSRTLPTRGGPA